MGSIVVFIGVTMLSTFVIFIASMFEDIVFNDVSTLPIFSFSDASVDWSVETSAVVDVSDSAAVVIFEFAAL